MITIIYGKLQSWEEDNEIWHHWYWSLKTIQILGINAREEANLAVKIIRNKHCSLKINDVSQNTSEQDAWVRTKNHIRFNISEPLEKKQK